MSRLAAGLFVLCAFTRLVTPAEAADLKIAGADGTAIKIAVDRADLSRIFLIQAADAQAVSDVIVNVHPLVGKKQRWVEPTWSWIGDGGERSREAKLSVPALGERKLRVSAHLPVPDTYVGTIDLIYGGARHTFTLTVERAAEELTVRDKELSVDGAAVRLETVLETKSRRAVSGVRVVAHPLIGPDGVRVSPRVTVATQTDLSKQLEIPTGGQAPLVYEADLPVPGDYKGTIDLVYAESCQTETLVIKRTTAALPVKIRPIETVSATTWPWPFRDDITLRVVIEGTRSSTQSLDRPVLATFSRKESEKVNKAVVRPDVAIDRVGKDGQVTRLAAGVDLDGQSAAELRVTIPGMSAGEYGGTFAIGTRDRQPLESAFTVYVRESWVIALLLIGASVFASYNLRDWALRRRPRLQAQAQLAQLSEDVDEIRRRLPDATPAELRVLDALSTRTSVLFHEWEADGEVDRGDARREEIRDKLATFPRWVAVRRRVASAGLPPPVAQPLRAELASLEDRFADPSAEAAALRSDVERLAVNVAKAIQAAIADAVAEVRANVAAQKKTPGGAVVGDRLGAEVEVRLKRAEALASDTDALDRAAASLDEARAVYARMMANAFEAQLPARSPDPTYLPQSRWAELGERIHDHASEARDAPDGAAAETAYSAAYELYLKALLEVSQARLEAADTAARALAVPQDRERARSLIQKASDAQAECSALLAVRDLPTAAAKYDEVRRLVGDAQEAATTVSPTPQAAGAVLPFTQQSVAGGVRDEPPPAVTPARSGAAFVGVAVQERAPLVPRRITVSDTQLRERIRQGEIFIAVVAGILAVLLGLKLLWVPSPTWGGIGDWITALLWGLGLHQVAGATLGQFDWGTVLSRLGGGGAQGGNAAKLG